jgi:hypothetical protein
MTTWSRLNLYPIVKHYRFLCYITQKTLYVFPNNLQTQFKKEGEGRASKRRAPAATSMAPLRRCSGPGGGGVSKPAPRRGGGRSGRGGGGRGRGGDGKKGPAPTKEKLDEEMDAYMSAKA